MQGNQPNHNWINDHPILAILGGIAAFIAIFAFLTGVINVPSIISPEARLQRKIIGTWQQEGGAIMTFYENGTFEEVGGFLSASGTYNIPDGQHIALNMSGVFGIVGTQIWQVEVRGNTMYVYDEMFGQTLTMSKLR